jgi:hypothetical protein
VRTMGANDVDLSLYKNFKIGEKRNLRFDVSSYNISNRPQLGMPNVPTITEVGTAAQPGPGQSVFGQITATVNSPRQYQFGARFSF